MSVVAFLLALLAVARVTRFVTSDTLAQPIRDAVVVRLGPESKPYQLITCPWCLSIWVAAPAAPIAYWWGDTGPFVIVCTWLGISWVYSIASTWLDRADD